VTPAASPCPPWCAASRTSAAARRSRTGEELEARVEVNRGAPGNPLSDEELARKFHDNAVRSLPEERAAEIAARTLALPDAQSVEDLTALLTSAGER
jgi:2-methylcitrate dehydratase PrpD